MKKIFIVCAAVFCAQAAMAAGSGDVLNAGDSAKRAGEASVAVRTQRVVTPAAAPVRLSDAEMDKVVAGSMIMWHGLPSDHGSFKLLPNAGGPNTGFKSTNGVYQFRY